MTRTDRRLRTRDLPGFFGPIVTDRTSGPLDGSTSGTIGGGGPESGGPGKRKAAPDTPPLKPENAASGRLEPDPFAVVDHDELRPGPSDVTK
jgi:hypothetical protein